jgi:hypothetical protein
MEQLPESFAGSQFEPLLKAAKTVAYTFVAPIARTEFNGIRLPCRLRFLIGRLRTDTRCRQCSEKSKEVGPAFSGHI